MCDVASHIVVLHNTEHLLGRFPCPPSPVSAVYARLYIPNSLPLPPLRTQTPASPPYTMHAYTYVPTTQSGKLRHIPPFSCLPTSLSFIGTSTSTSSAYATASANEPEHSLCIDELHLRLDQALKLQDWSEDVVRRNMEMLLAVALVLARANCMTIAKLRR